VLVQIYHNVLVRAEDNE